MFAVIKFYIIGLNFRLNFMVSHPVGLKQLYIMMQVSENKIHQVSSDVISFSFSNCVYRICVYRVFPLLNAAAVI